MYHLLLQLTLISNLALWLLPNQMFPKAPENSWTILVTKPKRGWRGSGSKWEYESVLYVPQTPGGELAAAMRAYEKKRGSLWRIRIVERTEISLKNKLFSSNPWAKDGCSRDDCFPCKPGAGEGGVCRRENLTYVMTCGTCSVNGVRKVYWGETSRTLYQRGKEHWSAYLSESDKSALHKHSLLEHPQSPPDWKIKVHNYHQRPLRR